MTPDDLASIAYRGLLLRPTPLLRHSRGGRHEVREGVALFSYGLPGPSFNKAVVVGPTPTLARVLELAGAFFGTTPDRFGVLVQADAGHPVEAELRGRGWAVVEDEPALVLPTIPEAPPAPPELEMRLVRDAAALRDSIAVAAAGFGAPTAEGMPTLPEGDLEAFGPTLACALDPDVAVLVGYAAGAPVCSAIAYRVEEVAGVTGVATVPDRRRRGYARAATWAALREASRRGCTCATLNALGASHLLYLGMGFVDVGNHRTYAAPSAPVLPPR